MSASLRRSSTSALATLPICSVFACSSIWSRTSANGGIFWPCWPARLLLGLRVDRAQLLLGRTRAAVLVRDEQLDEHLRLDLGAGLVLAHAVLLDGGEQLLGGAELVLLREVGELGVDLLVADLDAARLGLLREELGGDEVVGDLLLQRLLVGGLAARLRLRGGLLEGRLVERDELLLGDLLAVDLGDDVGDPREVGPPAAERVGARARGLARGGVLVRGRGVESLPPPQADRTSMLAAATRPRTVRVRIR